MLIKIAGLVIDVKNRFEYFNMIAKGFEAPSSSTPDFTVEVSDEVLSEAVAQAPEFPDGYIEGLEIYRVICRKILEYDGILMHCAAISVDNQGYLFTAVSGTGKTTHISLWHKKFGEKCVVVNGDKPILRMIDGKFYVCGTPWMGKENYGSNIMVPIKAICVLERGKKNSIVPITPGEALPTMLTQTLRTKNMDEMSRMLETVDKILQTVKFYRLKCNMDPEAADVAYNGMR